MLVRVNLRARQKAGGYGALPRLWRRGAGQSAARVPIRAAKTRKPPAASGHGSRLPLELAGLDLREDAVCRCNKRGCQDYFRGEKKRKLTDAMFQGNTNDPCLPKQYKVKKIKEIWGVRYALAPFEPKPASHVPCLLLPLARGRHTNLSKMSPKKRGTTLDQFHSEYIVYGDFECKALYTLATSAYWVPCQPGVLTFFLVCMCYYLC